MPAADQPAATATHVISMGMDMPVSLPMMPLYAIVMGDSGRHKHQRANYSRDETNSLEHLDLPTFKGTDAADYQHAHHLAVLAVWSIRMQ